MPIVGQPVHQSSPGVGPSWPSFPLAAGWTLISLVIEAALVSPALTGLLNESGGFHVGYGKMAPHVRLASHSRQPGPQGSQVRVTDPVSLTWSCPFPQGLTLFWGPAHHVGHLERCHVQVPHFCSQG